MLLVLSVAPFIAELVVSAPLYGHTTFCLSIHQLLDVEVFPIWGYYQYQ